MVEIGLIEISASPKMTFLGCYVQKIFGPHQRSSKALTKWFLCQSNHFGALVATQSRKMLIIGPKTRFSGNFGTPKIDLFGAGWSKFFRPAPKGSQSPQKIFLVIPNSFLGSVALLESKTADFSWKTEISESRFGRNFCMWVSGPPKNFFRPRLPQKYLQKKFGVPNSKWKSNYEKSWNPHKKGPFWVWGGGGSGMK